MVADEVRQGVLNRVSYHGGHVGPNLGFTEATVALHYVLFNAPEDKIVFDVSHQSYPHKMLTGRKDGFLDVSHMDSISGYSSPLESPVYDSFEIGHTSTSVALASGCGKTATSSAVRRTSSLSSATDRSRVVKPSKDLTRQRNWVQTSSLWSTTTR